jgi:hypothetical protein
MKKKNLGTARNIKKVIVLIIIIFLSRLLFSKFFEKLLEARPLASRVPLALCSAMQCRKGPSAARKGHMATPAGLDLSKAGRAAGPKALGLGSGQSSDRAGV